MQTLTCKMARIARVVAEGIPYHVTQRGNGRQQVFHSGTDYGLYRSLLRAYARQYGVSILAYCLMPNHTHLVCVPCRADSLARTLGRTHADFARHFNIARQSCGHVWQARFYSCPLDLPHLWRAMAYVERNPVRAGLISEAWSYPWSSAATHCGLQSADPLVEPCAEWQEEYGFQRWCEVLLSSVAEEAAAQRIREATHCGRPLGWESFVQELEQIAGRRLRPLPPGRPRVENERRTASLDGQLTLEMGV
jgi:putative transposase